MRLSWLSHGTAEVGRSRMRTRSSPSVVRELLRFGSVGLEEVRHLEHEVQGPPVARPHLVVGAEAIEDGEPRPEVGLDPELARSLPGIGVRDEEVCASGGALEILQIAHEEI